jgi:hypothetical protein
VRQPIFDLGTIVYGDFLVAPKQRSICRWFEHRICANG